LRHRGVASEVVHGTISQICERLTQLSRLHQVRERLAGQRVGVIGTPSDWLISSGVDPRAAHERWGIDLVHIPLDRVYEYYDAVDDATVADACAAFTSRAAGCIEPDAAEITKAMRLAVAIKRLVKEENLSAITLACFRLLERTATTGCLALSLLNDEGIMAGCEGDLQTLFTMMFVKAATGQSSFMANPSRIDTYSNEVIMAHCTIGLDQTQSYVIRNHFESLSGVAIQGMLPQGKVTVIKIGSPDLDRFFVTAAYLQDNLNNHNMCRTQVRLHFNRPASYFLRNSLGNHHVILNGDHVTLDAGTGCVHTPPGFGAGGCAVCKRYDDAGLTPIGVPV
ncbi:MAG: class I tRNA ligase family protein, partial [Muribaculaceae bacterium]|nr:class I tRNA ligase family protein [Muribaculaceae bacterium]